MNYNRVAIVGMIIDYNSVVIPTLHAFEYKIYKLILYIKHLYHRIYS